MPSSCLLRLSIEGDLRFLSHLDTLRVLERLTARAGLPVRYSQGFNPHPRMTLPAPRPVGVACLDDPVTIELDEPLAPDDLSTRCNAEAPAGMRFGETLALESRKPPRPVRAAYRLTLTETDRPDVPLRAQSVRESRSLPHPRRVKSKKRRGQWTTRTLDLRPLIASIEVSDRMLRFDLVRQGDLWARPGEVLVALGLDERVDLARLTRTAVTLDNA